jgi:hypothetical protein
MPRPGVWNLKGARRGRHYLQADYVFLGDLDQCGVSLHDEKSAIATGISFFTLNYAENFAMRVLRIIWSAEVDRYLLPDKRLGNLARHPLASAGQTSNWNLARCLPSYSTPPLSSLGAKGLSAAPPEASG